MQRTIITLLVFYVFTGTACTANAPELTPKEAILEMEKHTFNRAVLLRSVESLDQALEENPDNVWATIGMAEAFLHVGYMKGSRYEKDNYVPELLNKAYKYTLRAVELGPQNSRSYALLAKLQIIRGEYKTAWKTLSKAHDLDPNSFYPWYYLVVLNRYYQLYDKAKHYADRAGSLTHHTHHRRWIVKQLIEIADAQDNLEAEEQGYLKIIELNPERAHAYGNYAGFLYNQERYREAVNYYKKALKISRYPLAVRYLKKARERLKE
ncbi:MAG TPA: hypothetical protein VFP95_05015 [Gammaproteobacteria bacterium]|nr:hypothetical protein [Gammaproteobacteria bacterium]